MYPCRRENVEEFFDTSEACVVNGDLIVDGFDTGGKVVVVCGALAVKGGCDGSHE